MYWTLFPDSELWDCSHGFSWVFHRRVFYCFLLFCCYLYLMSSYLKVIFSFSLFTFLYYIFYLFVVLSTQVTMQTWDENTTCGSHYSFSTLCVQSVDVRPSGWCLYPLSLTSSLGILIVHKSFPFFRSYSNISFHNNVQICEKIWEKNKVERASYEICETLTHVKYLVTYSTHGI